MLMFKQTFYPQYLSLLVDAWKFNQWELLLLVVGNFDLFTHSSDLKIMDLIYLATTIIKI